jgi:organic hydroperoxide reductase OsmC/OhrA
MQAYPHHYRVSAEAAHSGVIDVSSPGLENLPTQAPAEFGGPGDLWSPETFLVAAVANCLILTFRAVARGARFEWNAMSVEVDGKLDRVDNVTQFTDFFIKVELNVPAGSDVSKAEHMLHRSEAVCLITNSLTAQCHLEIAVTSDDQEAPS